MKDSLNERISELEGTPRRKGPRSTAELVAQVERMREAWLAREAGKAQARPRAAWGGANPYQQERDGE